MTVVRGRRILATALGATLALGAAPAWASGGLNLMPDFTRTLPALLILFFLLVPVMKRLLFEPVLSALEERDQKIDGAREQAERQAREAETVLAAYEKRIRTARAESDVERKAVLESARQDLASQVGQERAGAERGIEHARGEIQGALESARGQLRRDAESLAREAAERILGRAL